MTVNRTTLLDLPLPVTGTESGTWGDTTNNGLSQYMDIAIAGMNSLTSANFTAGALTLANTLGDSSATNIAAGSAQYATIRVSSLAVNSTITAPGSNRSYRIINADATYSLTIKASGQTGVTFLPGQTGVVAFNGTDYVIVGVVGAGTATDNAVARFDGTTGEIIQNSGVTIDDSNNVSGIAQLNITTLDATNIEVTNIKAKDGTAAASIADSTGVISITSNPVLSGGTANGVAYLNGSKVLTTGSALTFDGSQLGIGISPAYTLHAARTSGYVAAFRGTTAAASGILVGNTAGDTAIQTLASGDSFIFSDTSKYLAFGVNGGTEGMRLTSTGLGIGTSSPSRKLTVFGSDGVPFFNVNGYDVASWTGATLDFGGMTAAQWNTLRFFTSGSERMRLDSSGNLGLGVTPSAWAGGYKAAQVVYGALANNGGAFTSVNQNCFYDGSNWKYIINGNATQFSTGNGTFQFNIAPSGTAGNAITFTQAMTLDASGNLLVGATAATIAAAGRGVVEVNGTSESVYASQVNGTLTAISGLALSTSAAWGTVANIPMVFRTNNTERARITSGGLVQVSSGGSVQIGDTAARATTAGTNRLDIFNGTAPVGTLSNGISIYSSSGEAYVMDAAGNATLFSPHDRDTNEWIFRSKHTPSGKVLKIDVERLLRFVNDHFGLDAVQEFIEP